MLPSQTLREFRDDFVLPFQILRELRGDFVLLLQTLRGPRGLCAPFPNLRELRGRCAPSPSPSNPMAGVSSSAQLGVYYLCR